MSWKWLIGGPTGYSFFDVSFLIHFAFWFFFASGPFYLKLNRWWAMAGCIAFAFLWEVAEHFLALKYPNVWKNPESWWNAWLSDPLVACPVAVLLSWAALDAWTTVKP